MSALGIKNALFSGISHGHLRTLICQHSIVLQRDFVLLRDFAYYYETLRFTLMGEPFS